MFSRSFDSFLAWATQKSVDTMPKKTDISKGNYSSKDYERHLRLEWKGYQEAHFSHRLILIHLCSFVAIDWGCKRDAMNTLPHSATGGSHSAELLVSIAFFSKSTNDNPGSVFSISLSYLKVLTDMLLHLVLIVVFHPLDFTTGSEQICFQPQ